MCMHSCNLYITEISESEILHLHKVIMQWNFYPHGGLYMGLSWEGYGG